MQFVCFLLFGFVGLDDDMTSVHRHHFPVIIGDYQLARVQSGFAFHAGRDQRRFRFNAGHRLPLHIGTHQSAIGVIVFQKRYEPSRDGNKLLRRDIHEIDHTGVNTAGRAFDARVDQARLDLTAFFVRNVGGSDVEMLLFQGGKMDDFIGNFAVFDFTVRSFNKTVFVDFGVRSKVAH